MGLSNPGSAASSLLAYTTKAANYTLLTTDGVVGFDTSGASRVATLPTAAGAAGVVLQVDRLSDTTTNTVTINTTSAQTMSGKPSGGVVLRANGDYARFLSDGTNWQVLNKQETSLALSTGSGALSFSTIGAAGNYGLAACSAALTYGTWEVTVRFMLSSATSTAVALIGGCGLYAADGANSASVPTALSAGNLVVGVYTFSGLVSAINATGIGANARLPSAYNTVVMSVTSPTTVFAVPQIDYSVAGTASVITVLSAKQIW